MKSYKDNESGVMKDFPSFSYPVGYYSNNERNCIERFRPCLVNGKKALFHRWFEYSQIVAPSPMVGGHSGGEVKAVLALIEFEDGTVEELFPNKIRFLDNYFSEYDFSLCERGETDERLS